MCRPLIIPAENQEQHHCIKTHIPYGCAVGYNMCSVVPPHSATNSTELLPEQESSGDDS